MNYYYMGDKPYRRKMLLGVGTILTSSLAGCSQQSGSSNSDGSDNDTSSDEGNSSNEQFEYPDGFSENGVEDFAVAFGEGSNYYSQRYLQIEESFTYDDPDTERTRESSTQIDSEQELGLFEVDSPDRSRTQYYAEGTLYIRAQENTEPSYQTRQAEFNKQSLYVISLIEPHVTDVEFESTITEQGTVEYTATEEAYGENHPIQNEYIYEEIDVTVEVDKNGLIQTLTGTAVDGDTTREFSYEFSYEEVDITEPDWVSEAEDSQPAIPDVSASFSESNGEVTVTLDSVIQANRVYVDTSIQSTIEGGITVDGRANYLLTTDGEGGEGESVTVSEYSSDTTVGVFAGVEEMERAQPVQTYDVESGSDGSSDSDT